MNILGIDPGTKNCGYAVICGEKNKLSLLEAGLIKMKEYKYGIIYICGKDEFQMQDINTAFDYIPDESNDCVIYTKEPIPIEIGVKPVKKELLYEEE